MRDPNEYFISHPENVTVPNSEIKSKDGGLLDPYDDKESKFGQSYPRKRKQKNGLVDSDGRPVSPELSICETKEFGVQVNLLIDKKLKSPRVDVDASPTANNRIMDALFGNEQL